MKVTLHCNNCDLIFIKTWDSSKLSCSKTHISRSIKCLACAATATFKYLKSRKNIKLLNSKFLVLVEKPKVKKRYYDLKFPYKLSDKYQAKLIEQIKGKG